MKTVQAGRLVAITLEVQVAAVQPCELGSNPHPY